MASDAPLIGLNAPLKNHCLALDILVPFQDLPICAVINQNVPYKIVILP